MPAAPTEAPSDGRRCPECGQRFSNDGAFCPFDGAKLLVAPFAAEGDPLVGATVGGRYEVLALLGEGGMGQVYEVRHVALKRSFALKVLKKELARDADLGARFIDEARATASIHHPNVVQITDFGQLPDGAPYFVMELLVGQTLAQVIKAGGPLPAGRAAAVLRAIAAALGAAHAAGVVHRDLKPDNVFLVGGAASAEVRVVDFGAAKIVGSSRVTRQGIVFGTPHYMSPEQASGQPVDHRADIYALGVIMYEMFTGRVPFEADTYMGVLTQHMFVQPTAPSAVCANAKELGALEDITLTCLAKKPEDRYASMSELADAIASVVNPTDGSVAPRGALGSRRSSAPRYPLADELEPPTFEEMRAGVESLAPPMRRPPWGWMGVAAAVTLALGLTWMFAGRSPASPAMAASAPPVVPSSAPPVPASRGRAPALAPPVPVPSLAPPPLTAAAVAPSPPAGRSSAPAAVSSRPRAQPATTLDDVGDPFSGRR